jgi:2-polyprenyl-3-methyl-5-hydroxy-6-metoxy-1,4-benzoquinol methylase
MDNPTSEGALLGGRRWRDIFETRGSWDLSEQTLAHWRRHNAAFFHYVDAAAEPPQGILDLGCGVGRRAITLAGLGYRVLAIDLDEEVLGQCSRNASKMGCGRRFQAKQGDIHALETITQPGEFAVITHSGVLEHFSCAADIVTHLRRELVLAGHVVFDVPIDTAKNRRLFQNDHVFRHMWDQTVWVSVVEDAATVCDWTIECHEDQAMTDHFVCLLEP